MDDLALGKRIKELRSDQKITLKQLSEKTGLSIGFLSQLERGLSSIAIDSLQKIALVFEVPLSYFFDKPRSKGEVVLKSYEQEIMKVIGSNFIIKSLSNDLQHRALMPRLIEILPHATHVDLKSYAHEGEEFLYVLEGILELTIRHEKHLLYPGDSAHYSSAVSHNWTNTTAHTVRFIEVSIPNPFAEGLEEAIDPS